MDPTARQTPSATHPPPKGTPACLGSARNARRSRETACTRQTRPSVEFSPWPFVTDCIHAGHARSQLKRGRESRKGLAVAFEPLPPDTTAEFGLQWRPRNDAVPRGLLRRGGAQQLKRSVARRLMSDVPLGVYLSGGLDSSIVPAYVCNADPGTKPQQPAAQQVDERERDIRSGLWDDHRSRNSESRSPRISADVKR